MKGENAPLPLESMGGGMRRALAIAASLVSVENGVLLVDEMDTGFHYSGLTKMWRLIFEISVKRNVQVFATTHSWDCVKSFQKAFADTTDDSGVLIRLERRDDAIRSVSYSKEELDIAIRQNIEVR